MTWPDWRAARQRRCARRRAPWSPAQARRPLLVLRVIVESGKPEERDHALRLIARLDLPEAKAFLHQRIEHETAPAVLRALRELAIEADPGTTPAAQPLADVEVFAGVALGEGTRAALDAWAKHRVLHPLQLLSQTVLMR